MRFHFLKDRFAETYNNLSHFLEITLHFHFMMPSRGMLKLAVLASRKLPTAKSLSPFIVGLNCLLR